MSQSDYDDSSRTCRFDQAVTEYYQRKERGEEIEPESLLAKYPDLADELRAYFAAMEQMAALTRPALSPNNPEPSVGSGCSFGDYELLEEIGRGGMGVVYRARQKSLNRIVALKMILSGEFASSTDIERFHTEAEAAASLDHAHIVPVYDIGVHQGRHYFSMKLIEGGSLAQRRDPFVRHPRAAAEVVRLVAQAVAHAHQHGVLHRDLKPANILLDPDGQPHVTDFGLARWVRRERHVTLSGAVVGTPSYMAPEQATNTKGSTTAVDVYALGAILYELLTGQPPFQAATGWETIEQVLKSEPRAPRSLNRLVPRDLEIICLKCLRKEPGSRYDSAAALAEDLQRFLEGKPIQARPVRAAEQVWRWARRNPAFATVSGLALTSLMTAVVLAILFALHQYQSAEALRQAMRSAEDNRLKAEHRLAENYLQTGLSLLDRGDNGGMLWLAQSLRIAPDNANDLQRVIRTQLAAWRPQFLPLKGLCQHQNAILAASFSPDGRTVMTAGSDNTARFWDVATGQPVGPCLQHPYTIRAVAYSPDGRTVVTASDDWSAQLWNAATGSRGATLHHEKPILTVAFSPDGKTVLTGSADRTARLWDTVSGRPRGGPLRHADTIRAVAFSPDGKLVLTSSDDHTARLWDAATGKPRGDPLKHEDSVLAAAFSPDGQTIATGCDDWSARLWDVATGKPQGEAIGHGNSVRAVAFSPDGRTVVTSDDHTARLWDTATGVSLGPVLPHRGSVQVVAFAPVGQTILTVSDDGVARLWDASPTRLAGLVLPHQVCVWGIAFSPDGKKVLTGCEDKTARFWDAATGQQLGPPLAHQGPIWGVAFSPDGKTVVTASSDKTAQLWEATTGKPLGRPFSHQDGVRAVAFSPDGKTVLTGSFDTTAQLWSVATGQPLGPPLRHPGMVTAVAFGPDSKAVLTGSSDGMARLWDVAMGKALGITFRHQGAVKAVAFSPDGKTVLTGSEDRTARLWDAATGRPQAPPMDHTEAVEDVAFSPDGKAVLTGSSDGTARLWDVATGQPVGPRLIHRSGVLRLAFSPTGKIFATASSDKTARLWRYPFPLEASPERIKLWTEVFTGTELVRQGAVWRPDYLDYQAWYDRRQALEKLDGPPMP